MSDILEQKLLRMRYLQDMVYTRLTEHSLV